MLRVNIGIHPLGFQWLLPPTHIFSTPEVVLVRSEHGLGGLSRELHKLYNYQLIPIHTINTTTTLNNSQTNNGACIHNIHTAVGINSSPVSHPLKHHNTYTLDNYKPVILLNTWESKYFTVCHHDVIEMAKLAGPIGKCICYILIYIIY